MRFLKPELLRVYTQNPTVGSLFQNAVNKTRQSTFPRHLEHSLVVLETSIPMVKLNYLSARLDLFFISC